MKIVFFGTDLFAARILERLLAEGLDIVAVITRQDKPQKRSGEPAASPVKAFIEKSGFSGKLYQPAKASEEGFVKELQSLKPDLFIVVSYGQLLRQNLLDVPPKGTINVHPSLLPKFRGPSPMQSALLAGEKETGVTIMEMVLAMDAGDILNVGKIDVSESMTYGELENTLCDLAQTLLLEVIQALESGKNLTKIPQKEEEATYTKKIEVIDSFLDWGLSAEEIHNKIRSMNPKPGARCYLTIGNEKKLLKILRGSVRKNCGGNPGALIFFDKKEGFVVGCQKDAIQIEEVQLEGKKAVSVKDFINGFCTAKISIA